MPLGLFALLKPYLAQIDNVHCLETILYSKKLTIAGQVDCIAEYNGKLSVIDFKTANKERNDEWNKNYYMQTAAYAVMYEELFGTHQLTKLLFLWQVKMEQVGYSLKNKADYLPELEKAIQHFYKYYEEKTKSTKS